MGEHPAGGLDHGFDDEGADPVALALEQLAQLREHHGRSLGPRLPSSRTPGEEIIRVSSRIGR